ncbi:MAG TPA: cation diffusion facilitator family transporter [Thermoanaerobaculaceae bacterium]|nr:cation diffusion facilitator family transporter [Thermoanaerobaculaceae bacterium]HRS15838.1 cation diffusion facilitator family transporter [Thermoanaerobaculaceae bacterium]
MSTAPPHGHHHHRLAADRRNRRRLLVTLALTLAYMVAEVLGAWLTNSLALLADAGHMLSDAGALGLALFAIWMAGRRPSPRHTFGFYRTEILAALANGALLAALAVLIVREAVGRLAAPALVRPGPLMVIAAGGLVVNVVGMLVLRGGARDSLNLRGAFLHVAGDALGSVQVLLAGLAIQFFGWRWVDPVASMVIAVLIVASAWGILRDAVSVLMEGVPGHLDADRVREAVLGVEGVAGVHDLHVWTIGSGFVALSAHVNADPHAGEELLWRIHEVLHRDFGIRHTTIQVERPARPEPLRPSARP